ALVDTLGPWEVQQSRLTNERDAAQDAYKMLLMRERELRIRSMARLRTAREIERAPVPAVPLRPRKTTNLVFSTILALLLAVSAAILQETWDDRVTSRDDVERAAALPTLGQVPLLSADQPRLMTSLPPNSEFAESYRALRSSIRFAGIESPIRRLLVTSAAKG